MDPQLARLPSHCAEKPFFPEMGRIGKNVTQEPMNCD